MSREFRILSLVTALFFVAVACEGILGPSIAQAERLDIEKTSPDVFSCVILVTYDALADSLTATGTAATLDLDDLAPPDYNITDGVFSLSATIDASGNASSGTLSISGTIAEIGVAGTLLTGNLLQFGFPETPGAETLDFVFEVTGGSLTPGYCPSPVGVWLHDTGFGGTFASSFDNDISGGWGVGEGTSDTFVVVPEPSSAVLLLGITSGLLALVRCPMRRF